MESLDGIKKTVDKEKNVYIYGAGKSASLLIDFFEDVGLSPKACIVTDKDDNPACIRDVPVVEMNELIEDGTLIISVAKDQQKILDLMIGKFHAIILLNSKIRNKLKDYSYQRACRDTVQGYYLKNDDPYLEAGMQLLVEKETDEATFRVGCIYPIVEMERTLKYCRRETFEMDYGKLEFLRDIEEFDVRRNKHDVEVYVVGGFACRFDDGGNLGEMRIPIIVGSVPSKYNSVFLTDATGENISKKNMDYSECTALYWIWKNTSGQRYVGLEHYRRRLSLTMGNVADMEAKGVDLVLALPQYMIVSVKDFFLDGRMSVLDWDLMMKYTLQYDNMYDKVIEKYQRSYIYLSCNLCVFKREWFDKYCEFAFQIASNVESEYEQRGVIRKDRYMGYIFENLLSMFVMRHKDDMQVCYTKVEWLK